jgi:hypothetical protein
LVQAQELRERVAQLQRDARPRGVRAAKKAADEALAAAATALQHSSEAHARAAKAHLEFAALLEKTGNDEQAVWHREAAAVDEQAAAFDLREKTAWDRQPDPER